MANAIDKLVISLGLDSRELSNGLQRASQAIADFGKQVQSNGGAIERFAASASKSTLLLGGVSDEAAARIMEIGSTGQKASLIAGRAMDGLSEKIGNVGTLLKTAVAPLLAAFAGGQILHNLSQMGESLDILSERTGVATDKIDAWAKANRDAGGSEEAFKSALETWTVDQGRSADDFFRMGEAVKGMTSQQAAYFLNAMGLSQDAAAVFTKFKDGAEEAAAAYKGVALTPEQAKTAREMNILWRQFTDQAQALGNVLAVTVLPIVNKVLKTLGDGVAFLRKHSQFVKIALTAVGVALAATYGRNLFKAIGVVKAFFQTVKAGQGVMAALNATMLANPIGLLIAGITTLALLLDDFFTFLDGGQSVFGDFLSFLGFSDEQIDEFRKTLNSFFEAIGNLPDYIAGKLRECWEEVKKIGGWISDLFSGLIPDFSNLETVFTAGIIEPLKTLGKGVVGFFDGIEDFFDGLPMRVAKAVPEAIDALGEIAGKIGEYLEAGIKAAIDWAKEAFQALIDQIGEWIADALNIGDKIKNATSGFADALKEKAKGALGGLGKFFFGDDEEEGNGPQANPQTASGSNDKTPAPYGMPPYAGAIAAKEDRNILSRLGDAISGFFSFAPQQATGGMFAAAAAASNAAPGVSNDMQITVTNNIQSNGDPEEIGRAIGGALESSLSRRNRMLVAAQSGVISK